MGDSNPEPESQQQGPQPPSDAVQPQMTMHPISYSSMPMHMYPFPPGMVPAHPTRTKRRQVKNACTNCQKACKKCDDARPCLRCVKYGIAEECVDSQRKERQKGIKRGPYKKRDGKTTNVDQQQVDVAVQPQGIAVPPAVAAAAAVPSSTPPVPYVAPVTYPPGLYPQYPGPPAAKPGETPMYYPQIFYAPIPAPHPQATGQDGEPVGYPAHQFYPATFIAPYPPQYATPYMMPHPHPHARPDAQMPMAPAHHYAPYPQVYQKPPSRGPGAELGPPQMMDVRRDGRMEHARMAEPISGGQAKSG
ncbi:hypothetical protein BD310DRAFT_865673 [Dichomitus squalens]|uniref:Transcription activator of gluconeogenesis ERT1 n=1 Tax=Dichomitus squalens TaxID=114155 RepID=A0A4Q9QGU4_9APHY|nr:hypothetical protein BD310DRAFT_865673 [Dichomitus squalens]